MGGDVAAVVEREESLSRHVAYGALHHQAQSFVDVVDGCRAFRFVFGVDGKQAARLADGHVFQKRLGHVETEFGLRFFQHGGKVVQIAAREAVEGDLAVGVDFALRQGEVEGADFDNGVSCEEAGGFITGGVQQGGADVVFAHVSRGDFGQLAFDGQQRGGFEMFGGNVDVERAVGVVAVGEFVEAEAAFAACPAALFVHGGVKTQVFQGDFGRRNGAGRVDESAYLQIGDEIDQLVELDVVVQAFLPLQG